MNQKDFYQALNITEDQLLTIFPSRYESLKLTPLEKEPIDRKRYVLLGTIRNLKCSNSRAASIIRFTLEFETGRVIPLLLINQSFYFQKLTKGGRMVFVCYYSDNRKAFIVSSAVDTDSYYVITGIKPCYSLPRGVSQSYFANQIKKKLSYPTQDGCFLSSLPKKLINKYQLMDRYSAFRCVHLPRNDQDLLKGLRVFKYEEALHYCVNALILKKEADLRKKSLVKKIEHSAVNSFVKNLSYKLTHDQLQAVREIVLDMESDKVMYRLLQGDVGTGKTIVSFVVLFANYLRGSQGLLMAPTYELALQHFNNAVKVFKDYGINIAFLSGNLSTKEKNLIISQLKDGTIDILISTHASISKNVEFKNLSLSIIDEQQRFGVTQREEILKKGESADLLMMSATPIPRTLSQIINSDIDVSTLNEFPSGIRNVRTGVVRSSDPLIREAVLKALESHRQVFVIAPKIEEGSLKTSSANSIYTDFCERFSAEKCQLLHGKIKKSEQEKIYHDFLSFEKPILVSTTIVEVGIDVSSAGLMIVYDANFFGLSSLHQLRGRIGRSGDFALALLVYDGEDQQAIDKLNYLADNSDGLKISEYDLKMRGSGSYSGERQSGKSELKVCNFVSDYNIFLAAKEDAIELLKAPDEKENSDYLDSLKDLGTANIT
ncbi:MAG: helicase-related protein [Bacilli bacterium]